MCTDCVGQRAWRRCLWDAGRRHHGRGRSTAEAGGQAALRCVGTGHGGTVWQQGTEWAGCAVIAALERDEAACAKQKFVAVEHRPVRELPAHSALHGVGKSRGYKNEPYK